MSEALKKALERAKESRRRQGTQTDLERILSLPVQDLGDPQALAAVWSAALRLDPLAEELRPSQAQTLEALASLPAPLGLAVLSGVGHGKTLAGFLVGAVARAQRPALLVPADLVQKTLADLAYWRTRYWFPSPRIWSHTALSSQSQRDALDQYAPDLIVLDEAHAFSNVQAVRTIRLVRYVVHHPSTRVVVMSGTLTSTSILECTHLLELALRGGSPLPLDAEVAGIWASVLDATGEPDSVAWRSLAPLVEWAKDHREVQSLEGRNQIRRAWGVRLRSTPGVISTVESSCAASLVIHQRRRPPDRAIVQALDHLRDTWCLPDGTELARAPEVAQAAKTLSLGFYLRWVWPGEVDVEWLEARRVWASVVRSFMAYHAHHWPGLDSPGLLETAAKAGRAPPGVQRAWEAWAPHAHKKPPPTEARWVSRHVVEDVADWVDSRERGLLWYTHTALADRLATDLGLRVYSTGDGDAPDWDSHPLLQVAVHSRGKNYQGHLGARGWADNYVLEPPGRGKVWEQLIGRTHRAGQRAHQVDISVPAWTWALRLALDKAVATAEYAENMTHQRQKLTIATWADPFFRVRSLDNRSPLN